MSTLLCICGERRAFAENESACDNAVLWLAILLCSISLEWFNRVCEEFFVQVSSPSRRHCTALHCAAPTRCCRPTVLVPLYRPCNANSCCAAYPSLTHGSDSRASGVGGLQGDLEKAAGLPVSPMMNRLTTARGSTSV